MFSSFIFTGCNSASSASACVALSMSMVNVLGPAALMTRFIGSFRVSTTVFTSFALVFWGQSRLASRYFFCKKTAVGSFSPCFLEYRLTRSPFSTVWLAYLFLKSSLNFSHGRPNDLNRLYDYLASYSRHLPAVMVQCGNSVPDCTKYDSHSSRNASGSSWFSSENSGSSRAGALKARIMCRKS